MAMKENAAYGPVTSTQQPQDYYICSAKHIIITDEIIINPESFSVFIVIIWKTSVAPTHKDP